MKDITATCTNLPSAIEDLSKFVLVGREKLTSVRAEIRAIDKLQLAEDVREQKRAEAQMLADTLLDAEVRVGELFKKMPTTSGGDRRSVNFKKPSGGQFETTQESKAQVTERLGFDRHQVQRFETLADHPDLVAQVKAEARENDDLPTRTAVLNLAKYKAEKDKAAYARIDNECELSKALGKALGLVDRLPRDDESLRAMYRGDPPELRDDTMRDLDEAIAKLEKIQMIYKLGGK
ncbi:MAG: hypothetical protein RR337_11980 [Clostridia bacterium]